MDPQNIDFALMEEWYRSYNKFTEVVRNPAHQYYFKLMAGDFLMYDNYRMLHARNSFTGSRWLRGVYFNHQHVWTKMGVKH